MTINRTTLLDLPLPVTGTEPNTWGDVVNYGLTEYLDISIAGSLELSTDADVLLASTEGTAIADNIGATTAQYAVLRCTGSRTVTRNITAPAWAISSGTLTDYSKTYIVVNETTGGQNIVLRATNSVTPTYTTGVTIVPGERAVCVWNGSDFVKAGGVTGGSNTQVQYNNAGVLGGIANATSDGTTLSMTSPKVITSINDTNGNELLKVTATGSAVNELTLANAATGNAPTLSATGDDTNIGINITPKGSGVVTISNLAVTTIDATNIEVTNIKAKDGTAAASIADSTGVVSITANPVLSGGTANGVLYLNGSKVATSGSALTFDGTTLTNTQASGAAQIAFNQLLFTRNGANYITSTLASLQYEAATNHIFSQYGGSELMRLTSTGLGIGTSSPAGKLHVAGQARIQDSANAANYILIGSGANAPRGGNSVMAQTGSMVMGTEAASNLIFITNAAEAARFDSSGNLGLGVTPSGWGSIFKASQIGNYGAFVAGRSDSANQLHLGTNSYYNGTNWIYTNTSSATRYVQASGAHEFYTAPSGTAGNAITFTQAMTLDASGRLGIGTTSPDVKLLVKGGNGDQLVLDNAGETHTQMGFRTNGTARATIWATASDFSLYTYSTQPIIFHTNATERARITSGGEFLVGTNTASLTGGGVRLKTNNGNLGEIALANNSGSADYVARFLWGSSPTLVGNITVDATSTAYNTSSDYRLKDNPQPLTNSGAFIDALKPKTWDWKSDGSKGVGFIAHEVQEVSPRTVFGTKDAVDADGKPIMQAMEYGSAEFIANIVAELQSLRQRVSQLEGN